MPDFLLYNGCRKKGRQRNVACVKNRGSQRMFKKRQKAGGWWNREKQGQENKDGRQIGRAHV